MILLTPSVDRQGRERLCGARSKKCVLKSKAAAYELHRLTLFVKKCVEIA
jgi:hypothetical protein